MKSLCCASPAEIVKETKSPIFHLGATSSEGKENRKVKAHTLHHGEGSFLLNFKRYEMYLSGRGKCGRVPALPPQPPNDRNKNQSTINNHLQFSFPVPVTVRFGVPGASTFLHRFKELVHKSQGGIVKEGFEVVWKRGGVV